MLLALLIAVFVTIVLSEGGVRGMWATAIGACCGIGAAVAAHHLFHLVH